MPRIRYINKNIGADKVAMIENAVDIIEEYESDGYVLTLRQLYYQFVARDMIPNTQASYNRLGDAVSDGRLLGMIDWNSITDNLRKLEEVDHWKNPAELLEFDAGYFRIDKWVGQEYRPEVWVEKDALSGVIDKACIPLDVGRFVCRGYASQSAVWRAGRRFKKYREAGQIPIVIHLGDHDPSGIDMTRDNRERSSMFAEYGVRVVRLALNMDQVEKYNPPPNPAKLSDSRAKDYIALHGRSSWELDALEPKVLVRLIQKEILKYRDEDDWQEKVDEEETDRHNLQLLSDNWEDVEKYLKDNFGD